MIGGSEGVLAIHQGCSLVIDQRQARQTKSELSAQDPDAPRRGLTPRGSLECNPEIPAFPGEENYGIALQAMQEKKALSSRTTGF